MGENEAALLTTKVDRLFKQWDKPKAPGCSIGIIKDGKMLYSRMYGLANLYYDIPNSPETVFNIGSNAKQFTADYIALLEKSGALATSRAYPNLINNSN